jgi:iron complex outermembrane receptor protein
MNRNFYRMITMAFFLFAGLGVMAQGTIKGIVVDSETGEGLAGATVVIDGAGKGGFSDFEGRFKFKVEAGSYTVQVNYLGYETMEKAVTVGDGDTDLGEIALISNEIGVDGVEILASLAKDRLTPVAASNIDSKTIDEQLSNQEFPEIMRNTPSVYVTRSGGGFGDARINVRGFDQRNTAVLINGIPVNDMENGWVYWSNWAGLADVTRTIQIQRGLGASKLAINSVGGTINLITKTTDMKAGGSVGAWVGNDGYLKLSAAASTGRLEGGWAVTVAGSRTQGNGYVDATWIDAWSYFGSVAKDFGAKHQLVFTAIGAPQRHGQRTFMDGLTNKVPFDSTQDYTEMIGGSTTSDFDNRIDAGDFNYSPIGNVRYNSDWGVRDGEIFSIRENFYHKPQFALNHYWTESDNFNLKTSAYYSIGRGGGTGDRGRINGRGTWGFRDNDGIIRVDDIVAWNQGTDNLDGFPADGHYQHPQYGYVATENTGLIKRASMNEHNWMGILSTANVKLGENINLIAGVDIRHYVGLHYRRVEDLMGNDFWLESRNGQAEEDNLEIRVDADGDGTISSREEGVLIAEEGGVNTQNQKVNYDNDGIVGWQGLFAQLEVTPFDNFNFFVAASGSNTSYKRIDRFNYVEAEEASDRFNFLGYNAKAGANYNVNENHNVFFNVGYYDRAPTFDGVFPFFTNENNENVINEKVFGLELGYGFRMGPVNANLNLYRTAWNDRTFFVTRQNLNGDDFTTNLQGVNAVHQGIELEVVAKPVNGLRLTGMVSLGDWQWANNVNAVISDDNNVVIDTVTVYAEGLKVGDAAQTTFGLTAEYTFPFGLKIWAKDHYAMNLYADFDPTTRTAPEDAGVQAYKLPAFNLLDAGLSYRFAFDRYAITVMGNVNNLLDELYVAEANDNPGATGLQDLQGYFGFGRTWSAGLKFTF